MNIVLDAQKDTDKKAQRRNYSPWVPSQKHSEVFPTPKQDHIVNGHHMIDQSTQQWDSCVRAAVLVDPQPKIRVDPFPNMLALLPPPPPPQRVPPQRVPPPPPPQRVPPPPPPPPVKTWSAKRQQEQNANRTSAQVQQLDDGKGELQRYHAVGQSSDTSSCAGSCAALHSNVQSASRGSYEDCLPSRSRNFHGSYSSNRPIVLAATNEAGRRPRSRSLGWRRAVRQATRHGESPGSRAIGARVSDSMCGR